MKKLKLSLQVKTICCVVFGAFILGLVAIWISYHVYGKAMNEYYQEVTMKLAKTEATVLDKKLTATVTEQVMEIYRQSCQENSDFEHFSEQQWSDYYAKYDSVVNSEEFQTVQKQVQDMAKVNNVSSMYICYMDEKTNKAVYIADGTLTENACKPGTCDDIEERNRKLMKEGIYDFPAYITNYKEYGWLCSASAGIFDENGKLIANAYVDISMDAVMAQRQAFLNQLGMILMLITVALTVLFAYALHRAVISPIDLLAFAVGLFVSEKEKNKDRNKESAISKLEIHTGDEIEKLAVSIKKMEQEINTYINNLTVITAEKERIGAELNVATQIQASMLPCIFPAFPERDELDIYATMTPAKEVGGDFYDFFMLDDRHIAIVMADVSGKGVPAALFMVIGKTLIKNHTQPGRNLGEVFTEVNNILCESNENGMFITAFEGILDLVTGEFRYVNAGHEMPFIYRKESNTYEAYKIRPGFVLAGMENMKYREQKIQLNVGDKIYQYTDGVTEATDKDDQLYGMDRLNKVLNEQCLDCSVELTLQRVKKDIDAFVGDNDQFDDITMLCLEYKKRMEE